MSHTTPQTQIHTILFVDDDAEALDTWVQRFQSCSPNYRVLKTHTVESAIDLCCCQKMDCVVLDLDMGDASGFDVLLSLVPDRNCREIAVVVLTHLVNPTIHALTVENGAHACLVKQRTSPQQLDNAIQTAIASRQRHAH